MSDEHMHGYMKPVHVYAYVWEHTLVAENKKEVSRAASCTTDTSPLGSCRLFVCVRPFGFLYVFEILQLIWMCKAWGSQGIICMRV